MMRVLIWLAVGLTCGLTQARAAAQRARAKPAADMTAFDVGNTADLPDHCPASRYSMDLSWGNWKMHAQQEPGSPPELQPIDAMLALPSPEAPTAVTYLYHQLDWYAHRAELKKRVQARIAQLPASRRQHGLDSYAFLLLYLGEFDEIVSYFGPRGPEAARRDAAIDFVLAQAYFRLGRYRESQPLARRAVDLLPERARDTRWQLMLTEMGLYGKDFYEKHDDKRYSVEWIRKLFPADAASFPFEDVTDAMGIARWSGTGTANFVDLDGDGWDDLLIQRKDYPSKIYRNDHGRFRPVSDESVPDPWCNDLMQSVADYDNDGKPDLQRQCCNFQGPGPTQLFKNLGGFRFKDVTKGSGLEMRVAGMLTAWADYDLDGNLDYVVTDHTGPVRLYHNNGDGTFTDVTKKAGLATPGGRGPEDYGAVDCAWGDYDGDRYPDLHCDGWGWSRLYHNNGDGTFTDVTQKAGIDPDANVRDFNTLWFDYDNDGKLDLFVARYVPLGGQDGPRPAAGGAPVCACGNLLSKTGFTPSEWRGAATIFRNNGDGTFTNVSAKTRFLPFGVMASNAADWSNSGHESLVLGVGGPFMQQAEPFLFYENNGDGTFALKTPFLLRALWGKGHGMAFADYDHDGNLDLFLINGGHYPGDSWKSLLLRNKGNANHWLGVSLRGGPGTNRFAVGAQVELWAGDLHEMHELSAGGRFAATNTFALHFGLAGHARVDRLVVRWPNKRKDVTELKDVPADRMIEIDEKTGALKTLWTAPR